MKRLVIPVILAFIAIITINAFGQKIENAVGQKIENPTKSYLRIEEGNLINRGGNDLPSIFFMRGSLDIFNKRYHPGLGIGFQIENDGKWIAYAKALWQTKFATFEVGGGVRPSSRNKDLEPVGYGKIWLQYKTLNLRGIYFGNTLGYIFLQGKLGVKPSLKSPVVMNIIMEKMEKISHPRPWAIGLSTDYFPLIFKKNTIRVELGILAFQRPKPKHEMDGTIRFNLEWNFEF